jgi:hypothetical protein
MNNLFVICYTKVILAPENGPKTNLKCINLLYIINRINKMIKNFLINDKLFALVIVLVSITIILQSSSNIIFAQNSNSSKESNLNSISIPVSKGYVNGNISYFISTDASEKQIVSSITNTTKFIVNYAPSLADTPQSDRQQGYVFINGVKGDGLNEFQLPVASAVPTISGNNGYSPLFQINYVKWNDNSTARLLKSVDQIMDAQSKGEISVTKTNVVINSPFVQIK